MKKIWVLTMAAILAATTLAGCGGTGSGAPAGTQAAEGSTAAADESAQAAASGDVLQLSIACNATNQEHMYNYGINEFKRKLEEVSEGRIQVTTYAGTIGTDESELVEKLQLGGVDIVVATPGFMTAVGIPEIDILSLYYLFDNADSWKSCMAGDFGTRLASLINEKSNNQFRILDYWSSGIRCYYGKKAITRPEDLTGMSIRTQSAQVVKEFWTECGAIPTSIAWAELYQALQQGVVDGAENDYVSMSQKDQHKTPNGKYFCETEHQYLTPVLLTTGEIYDSLTEEQKGWLDEAVKASTEIELEKAFGMAEEAKQKIIQDGAIVTDHEDMDIDAFMEIARPIQDKFAADYHMEEYLEMIRSSQN